MSAIDDLRDLVAVHSGSVAIAWPRAELIAVLQEVDELKRDYATNNESMWKWYDAYHRLKGDFEPAVDAVEDWTMDDVIAVTPEQLVRIVREAGKP